MAAKNAREPAAERPATPRPAGDDGPAYSIRFSSGPDAPCACGRNQVGSGPVGYRGEEAVCDLCMLEGCTELGLVLALVAVARAFEAISRDDKDAWLDALEQLVVFLRVYELVAAKTAPPRAFRIPDSPLGGETP
ncbi:MAG: hypothetical protein GY719_06815 [bacterium]|nr:hypothetical protein [bacterium]